MPSLRIQFGGLDRQCTPIFSRKLTQCIKPTMISFQEDAQHNSPIFPREYRFSGDFQARSIELVNPDFGIVMK
jgi:hypothetical protein